MASVIYPYLANAWLSELEATACYAGVFFEVPSSVDPAASECSGVSYTRSVLTWTFTTSTSRTLANVQLLEWLNLQDTSVVGIGTWNSPVGGDLLMFHQLDEVINIAGRGSYSLDAGLLYVHL